MEGHLYVNEDENGAHSEVYSRRYFVLFPFCGLRWFLQEPDASVSYSSLLQGRGDDGGSGRLEAGWVCGGNVKVDAVTMEKTFVLLSHDDMSGRDDDELEESHRQQQSIYPFVVKLRCGVHTTQVRLASDTEAERLSWVRELRGTESMQTYLMACVDRGVAPSRKVFAAMRSLVERRDIHFENMHLSSSVLSSVVKYVQQSAPHGCVLHSLRMENAQLDDQHAALVCTLLESMPHLTLLSLAENAFTDQGATAIAGALKIMSSLQELDLSCNRIGDAGLEALVVALEGSTKQLARLDLSRNMLTSRSVRAMALHLSGYNSRLRFLNLSYNALGNGAAALISRLMQNKPAVLVDVDLSFTGVSESGIKELTGAITECDTLQHLRLKGNPLSDHAALMALVDAVSRHQKEFFLHGGSRAGRGAVGLSLHLGGLRLEQQMPRCLSYRSLKKALPYVEDHTALRSVVLRRRLLVAANIADDANSIVLPKEAVMPIVSFRVQLPLHIYSIQEFVEALAGGLRAHPQQLRVVSASATESLSRSCSFDVCVEEATPRSVSAMRGRTIVPIYTARLPAERVSKELEHEEARSSLPSVRELLDSLRKHCMDDSPLFRRLGIRSMTLQAPPQPENPAVISFFKGDVCKSGTGGRMDLPHSDEHLAVVTPNDATLYSTEHITGPDESDEEEEELESQREREHKLANVYYSSGSSEVGVGNVSARMQFSEEILRVEREAQRSKELDRKQRRMVSERLVLAVRQLRREEEIDTPVALFWEGAFGNNKCRAYAIDALRLALNEYGIFHAVGRWNLLCEAMSLRDAPVMAAQIMHMKEDALDGGTALLLGQRLLSEIISLQRDAINLDSLAAHPENIAFVENFMLLCGKLGYSGPEMTAAADHRKKLILWAADEHKELIADTVDLIRQRALMSNLMISRDFVGMAAALDELKGERSLRMGNLPEVLAARALLQEYKSCTANLVEAIKLRRIPRLEKALAEAAFVGIGLDNAQFARATRALADLSSVPAKLLKPIVQALREGDVNRVENALEAAYSMGWRCPALGLTIAPKILRQMKGIAAKDQARATLVRLALSVKNGYRVNAGEVLQLLRRAEALGLQKGDESIAHHFEQLSKYVKRFAAVLKEEKEIQRMIDDEEIDGLQELLTGRGHGRLIVNCSSEELCRDWLEMLQAAALGVLDEQPIPDDELLMAGSMDKAARSSTGHLHSWRGRYFVLQGKLLTYFTARNGDRKGSIRVYGGGAKRLAPEEAQGRKFAVEVLEGRDMTLIDADLLAEAKKTVDSHLIKDVTDQLLRGIAEESLEPLETALLRVEGGVLVEFGLVRRARMWVKRLRERHLKTQLHQAALTVPRGHIDELIRLAQSNLIDPNNALLARLVRIAEQPDLCQCILRARGAVEMRDEVAFRRAITSLAKFEVKRFSSRDMRMTTAVFLQHAGYRMLRSHIDGEPSLTADLLRHVLSSCRQLAIETEAMQVAKLLLTLQQASQRKDDPDRSKTSGLLAYLDESSLSASMASNFTIDQFQYLRPETAGAAGKLTDTIKGVGSFFTRLLGQSKSSGLQHTATRNSDRLAFTDKAIKTPMLQYESSQDDDFIRDLATRCFLALQVVMGDRPLKGLKRSQGGQIKMREDIAFVMADLVDVGTGDHFNPKLSTAKLTAKAFKASQQAAQSGQSVAVEEAHNNNGDELYVQLCKQLSGHPVTLGRLRGWLLFSVYLHAFAPTKALMPYLRNFIAHAAAMEATLMQESMQKVQIAHESLQEEGANVDYTLKSQVQEEADRRFKRKIARQEELEARASITKVASYCLKLLAGIQMRDSHDVVPSRVEIGRSLCASVIGRAKVSFKITLLTGSEYTFCVKYGEIDTPYSLLPMLYGRMIGGDAELRYIVETYHLRSKHHGGLAQAWQDWLLTLFRGTAFYMLQAEGEGEEVSGGLDSLHDIPVQADDALMCEWTHDVLWDLVTRRTSEAAARAMRARPSTGKHSGETKGGDEDDASEVGDIDSHLCMHLVLRRRVGAPTECLAGQLELFSDQVADNDLVALRGMWIDWLGNDRPLPADHIRVDLLFAEETRCVNSHIYHSDVECFYYLLGMQLALSWEDAEPHEWGEGATAVLADCDLSVRPMHAKPFNFKSSLRSSRGGGSQSSRSSRRASRLTRLSTFFRRSIMGPSEVQRVGEHFRKRLTLKDSNSFALFGDALAKRSAGSDGGSVRSDSEASNVSGLDQNDHQGSEFYDTSDSESTYDTDDSEHNPSSPDTSDSEGEKERKKHVKLTGERLHGRRARAPLVSFQDLYKHEADDLRAKMRGLGINEASVDLQRVVEWMVRFHQITDQPSGTIGTDSAQYRYLLKRAYLHYLHTWPLYGYSFSEAVLVDGEQGQRNVVVGVGPCGLLLLDPDEWTVVLRAELHDIERCELKQHTRIDDIDDDDEPEDEDDDDDLGPVDDASVRSSSFGDPPSEGSPSEGSPSESGSSKSTSSRSSKSTIVSMSSSAPSTSASSTSASSSASSRSSASSHRRRQSRLSSKSTKSKLSTIKDGSEDDESSDVPPSNHDSSSSSSSRSSSPDKTEKGVASDEDEDELPSDEDELPSDDDDDDDEDSTSDGESDRSSSTGTLPDDTRPTSVASQPSDESRSSYTSSSYTSSSYSSSTASSSRGGTTQSGRSSRTGKSGGTGIVATSAITKAGRSRVNSRNSQSQSGSIADQNASVNASADQYRLERLLHHDHLVLTINGELTIRLVGSKAREQQRLMEQCGFEVLGRGAYPHGSEGGTDLQGPGEVLLAASDTKEIMRRFVREFPILPIPPIPPPLAMAPDYRAIPKSKIEAKLLEREESERLERENAAHARNTAEEKMRKEHQQGKELVKNRGPAADEPEEDEEEEEGGEGAREDKNGKARAGGKAADETGLNALVSQSVCGVAARFKYASRIPPPPQRQGGRLQMDSQSGRMPEQPELSVLAVPHPSSLPPVGTSWGGSTDAPPQATPSRYSPLHSPKKVRTARLAQPRWGEHASQYIARSNALLETIVQSEQLIGQHRENNEDVEYVYVGNNAKRRKKKDKGLKFN